MAYSILIVDGLTALRGIAKRVLDISGIEVDKHLETAIERAALPVLGMECVDLIVTDVNMSVWSEQSSRTGYGRGDL